jgi:plastocyanin
LAGILDAHAEAMSRCTRGNKRPPVTKLEKGALTLTSKDTFMRKFVLAGGLSALASFGLVHSFLTEAVADDVKAIGIVKNADGKFVFTDPNAKIKEGQTVKWVAIDSGIPHQLVADSESDALTDTGAFDSTNPPSQKFDKAGVIHYHCTVHPKSMRGTITVAAAEAPAEEAVKAAPPEAEPKSQAEEPKTEQEARPPRKRKSKPSYGYGY